VNILELDRASLRRLLRAGHPIEPSALDDTEYDGVSLGLPSVVERLTWKKFRKVFHRDPRTGALRGWNVRVEQNGLVQPWTPRWRGGAPLTFGHYRVTIGRGVPMPERCDQGLLLDYGRGGNRRGDPIGLLRDPLVALEPGDARLLLGWTYLALGPRQVGTPSYFLLTRAGPLSHRVEPPRRAPR
jgi:hypothetical protein